MNRVSLVMHPAEMQGCLEPHMVHPVNLGKGGKIRPRLAVSAWGQAPYDKGACPLRYWPGVAGKGISDEKR